MKKILVTGVAGFIGFHLAGELVRKGYRVIGVDTMNPYYDLRMKRKRLALLKHKDFKFYKASVVEYASLERIIKKERPEEIVHLAAQAGVRYSLINPAAYAEANYIGTLNVFEAARHYSIPRVVYASSSSVYGANEKSPFAEGDRVDRPISVYAASKRATELLAYTYNHLFGIETTGLRFFTVYGTWGRPDMALFKFTRRMLMNEPIELYNNGKMLRSFTHVSDIVAATLRLLKQKPTHRNKIYNLGGSEAVPLIRFVEILEKNLGMKAKKVLLPMQPGDVERTLADTSAAKKDLGYKPKTTIEKGIAEYVAWFLKNKRFLLSLSEPKQ